MELQAATAGERAMRRVDGVGHHSPRRRGTTRGAAKRRGAALAGDAASGLAGAGWPTEAERIARINSAPSGVQSVGEQYLDEAFFVRPRWRRV